VSNTTPRVRADADGAWRIDGRRMVVGYDLATVKGRTAARRDAEAELVWFAVQAGHHAREAVETAMNVEHGGNPAEVAIACAAAATAWAAVHHATRPNGAVP
jgi:hypothetical protein